MEFHPAYFFDLSHYAHASLFRDCELVWDALKHIESYLKERPLGSIEVEVPPGVHLVDRHLISIGKNTVLEPGAYIKGPCLIGEHCTVRQGAYLRGEIVVGDHCVLGHDTEIKHSILLNHAHAAHFAYVGDTILGNQTNLGAGTKCANLRLDNGEVIVIHEGKRFSTGLRKLGAILGDGSQTGCNSVLNPGTLFGKGVVCYPVCCVGGCIPSHHKVVMKQSETVLLPYRTSKVM